MELVLEDRASALPRSRLPEPESLWQRTIYTFWAVFIYVYQVMRDVLTKARILKHDFRQEFVLGRFAEGKDLKEFLKYIERQGFGNHFIAWVDKDEVISLRRVDGFEWQYHLRVFKDGEVRGHYEYTPEAHPFLHIREVGMVDRREEFLAFLGDWVVPALRG